MNNLLYNTKKLLDINSDGRSKEFKKVERLVEESRKKTKRDMENTKVMKIKGSTLGSLTCHHRDPRERKEKKIKNFFKEIM